MKNILKKIFSITLCVMLIAFLTACTAASGLKREYDSSRKKYLAGKLDEDEYRAVIADIYERIASGDVSEASEYAELVKYITGGYSAFDEKDVFALAGSLAEFYDKYYGNQSNYGISGISLDGDTFLISYVGAGSYSVRLADKYEQVVSDGKQVDYDGSLGEYRVVIEFTDTSMALGLATALGSEDYFEFGQYKVTAVENLRNGYNIYIGSDEEITVDAVEQTNLILAVGTIEVKLG